MVILKTTILEHESESCWWKVILLLLFHIFIFVAMQFCYGVYGRSDTEFQR